MTERFCAHCGTRLVRREDERPSKFAARESCNRDCGAHLSHKRLVERSRRNYGITDEELARRNEAGLCGCGKPLGIGANRVTLTTCGAPVCRGWVHIHETRCLCGAPRGRDARGRLKLTCGSRPCRAKASVNIRFRPNPEVLEWPKVSGEVIADFSAHEIAAKDGGYGFKIIKADDRSYAGCSAAYTAGVA